MDIVSTMGAREKHERGGINIPHITSTDKPNSAFKTLRIPIISFHFQVTLKNFQLT